MQGLFQELKRRNVFRVAIAYVVMAWLVLQVGETLAPALRLPEWVTPLLAFFLILGFPLALFFAWAFELTPEGLKKEKDIDRTESITHVTGRKIDFIIIGLLVAALGYFGWQHWVVEDPGAAQLVDVEADNRSIAVMPFLNMSSDPEQEFFSDGLSEELLNLLAKIPDLRVTSRSSSFAFKDKDITVPDFARALGVAHVLEGSVRRSGNTIRITAQLIDARSDVHLWSDTWDRTLSDIFAIQDEIAGAVVDQLRIELLDEVPTAPETDPEAYALYMRGLDKLYLRTVEDFGLAEKYFKQALEIDPNYAPAWGGLSRTYGWAAGIGVYLPMEATPLIRDAAVRALELDPGQMLALTSISGIYMSIDFDFAKAADMVDTALREHPGDTNALLMAASYHFITGNKDEALRFYREIYERDPLNASALTGYASTLAHTRRLEEAIEVYRRVEDLAPDAVGTHYYIALVLMRMGDIESALAELEDEVLDGFRFTGRAIAYHLLGNPTESDANLDALNAQSVDWAYQRVAVYAVRGELDKAFEWLDTAIEIRDLGLNLIMVDTMIDNLRDDPRFLDVLKRLNREQFL